MVNTLINILIYLVVSAVVIWIVSNIRLGLTVRGFSSALVAAAVIALVGGMSAWLLGVLGINLTSGLLAAIISVIVAAIVLLISDRFLPGLEVQGFSGAVVAAIAIGIVGWFVTWVLSVIGIIV